MAEVDRGGRSVVWLPKVVPVGRAQSQDQGCPSRLKAVSGGLNASRQKEGKVSRCWAAIQAVIINWESRRLETVRVHIDADPWGQRLGDRDGRMESSALMACDRREKKLM